MKDSLDELMEILESLCGVQLKKEKRSMVETRLARRVRSLGLSTIEQYVEYFHLHRESETVYALSLVTTHTTEFFREEAHFDYLMDYVFPQIFQKKKSINIWSAACSTGQEVYSLAIALLEYMRMNNIPPEKMTSVQIFGSDIDKISVQTAQEGVYPFEQVAHLNSSLIDRYFDRGEGDFGTLVRVKDHLHRLCHFKTVNLITDNFSWSHLDIVFLRNAVIYFKPEDIENIMGKVKKTMSPEGFFFLGHSESLAGLNTAFKKIGNSIYSLDSQENSSQDLIVIGASTGGVEALKVVLEQFPVGCPPILIVQHIPETFSKALADRLNECCSIRVSEAKDKEILEPSHAYIAPGGKQMKLIRTSSSLMIEINNDPPLGLHKPSVDYLFKSILPLVKDRSVSAGLLTGMGSDGARGLKELRTAGAYTVAQNEATSVVFGMPGTAVEMGGAVDVAPLERIAGKLLTGFGRKKNAA